MLQTRWFSNVDSPSANTSSSLPLPSRTLCVLNKVDSPFDSIEHRELGPLTSPSKQLPDNESCDSRTAIRAFPCPISVLLKAKKENATLFEQPQNAGTDNVPGSSAGDASVRPRSVKHFPMEVPWMARAAHMLFLVNQLSQLGPIPFSYQTLFGQFFCFSARNPRQRSRRSSTLPPSAESFSSFAFVFHRRQSFSLQGALRPKREGALFEAFLVVGAPSDSGSLYRSCGKHLPCCTTEI